jgi:cysteine desulfuration protein SufE
MTDYLQEFQDIQDVDQKYEHLIDISRLEPKLKQSLKTSKNLIKKCQNKIWLVLDWTNTNSSATSQKLNISFESESRLVAGMVFLVKCKFSGLSKQELLIILEKEKINNWLISTFDPKVISMTRQNGIASIISTIREFVNLS